MDYAIICQIDDNAISIPNVNYAFLKCTHNEIVNWNVFRISLELNAVVLNSQCQVSVI